MKTTSKLIRKMATTVAALALGLVFGCKPPGGGVLKFETTPAARADIVQHVTASGTLSAVVSVDVGSQVSGKVSALYADFNSPVKKGQLVAEIDPSVYEAAFIYIELFKLRAMLCDGCNGGVGKAFALGKSERYKIVTSTYKGFNLIIGDLAASI